ncbi:MAG: 4Fe-4S binding protein [Candidatus Methanoplasma sp.]|jgi:epoxyqueuosine reductase QueG|nr:4Fe-4S binding protein [Candidatus Methanoplasma sp.]
MGKIAAEINSEMVKELGIEAGAAVVGIASSKDFGSAPGGKRPSDVLESCLSVVVLGIPFRQDALLKNSVEYTEIRNEALRRMNDIAKEVTKQIKSKGYDAVTIVSVSEKISLKHAAELAGLGVIGRNYLLTNPEYGNLLWFSAVLTNADLTPDERARYTVCNNCNICVEMCPTKALDDPVSFGRKECSSNFKMVGGKLDIRCFLCRKVCPYWEKVKHG